MSVFRREIVFVLVGGLFGSISVCVCSLWFLCNCFAASTGVVENILNLVLMSAKAKPLQLLLEFQIR